MSTEYTSKDIQSMPVLQAMRNKLGMYFGSAGKDAVQHGLLEIISNSIDEHLAGFGDLIEINFNNELNQVTVRDYGRGIPFEKITEVATKIHSSGKFKEGDNAYKISGGLNGIGLKLATATGTLLIEVYRQGKMKRGAYRYNSMKEEDVVDTKEKDGTKVIWIPDEEPFKGENYFEIEEITSVINNMLYLLPKLSIKIQNKMLSKDSALDFFKENLKEECNLVKPYTATYTIGDTEINMAFVWNSKKVVESSFVNLIPTPDHGTHITALKSTLTREFNKFFNCDLSGELIRKNFSFIVGVYSPIELTFVGQAKSKLKTPELTTDCNAIFKQALNQMFEDDKKNFEKLVTVLNKIAKNSDVEKALNKIINNKKKKSGLLNLSNKYDGCRATSNIELVITEGNSAKSSLKLQRNDHQALYAIRGKLLNVFDRDLSEIIKNDEIKELMGIIGTEKEGLNKFSKIIIASDADNDGEHIRLLVFSFFARFYPEFVKQGKIFFVKLPPYMGRKGDKIAFAFTEEEKDEKLKDYEVSFLKGLGELDDELLAPFILKEPTRQLIEMSCEEDDFEELLDTLAIAFSKDKENAELRKEIFE